MNKQKLTLEQTDKKLSQFKNLNEEIPQGGWIHSIRISLNMTLRQLAKRLNITVASAKEIEDREKRGSISINSLRKVATAVNMKFVYGFIPKADSLEQMIEKRALELAKEIVMRTSNTMALEDQENVRERIAKAIQDKKEEIIRKMPRYLWD